MDLVFYILAVVVLILACFVLYFSRKQDNENQEQLEKDLLKKVVVDVKDGINNLISHYPNLEPDAVIEGTNSHKHLDQGNIFDKNTNLTFPIHTPTAHGVDGDGRSLVETRNYITITVKGTVSSYQVEGRSKLSKKKTYKVIYASKQDNIIEGMIHPQS